MLILCLLQLPHGNKYGKSFILKTLLEHLTPLTLFPIMVSLQLHFSTWFYLTVYFFVQWTGTGPSAVFYVDDSKVAEKLYSLDREIQCPDGFFLIIRVNVGYPTVDDVPPPMQEKIKVAMAKRYNSATKALDLTKFHTDPDLQDVFCALFKPIVAQAVFTIIYENIPEIEALNLQENRLQILSIVKKVIRQLEHLKVLHLGNNKVI